ncbi:Uu.00g139650.m01.CDS01 [Anthostomella pinea]|uniref:Uu.00g139650.m01.CDS01 n=1 Tax=Anthostomella pinea TaxID=933095 RepID=A0AAI8VQQ9_9PEZI|nr:Uu.00g139650.m01.CDS01 [Anthostomella pinea]
MSLRLRDQGHRPLRDQEDRTGTYMELFVVDWLIKERLVKGQPIGETCRVWNEILHQVFQSTDGYSTGMETLPGGGKAAELFTSLLVIDVIPNYEKTLLVITSNAPGLEDQAHIWLEAAELLGAHLAAIDADHRKFGAVAVGKAVRFYEWKVDKLVDLEG